MLEMRANAMSPSPSEPLIAQWVAMGMAPASKQHMATAPANVMRFAKPPQACVFHLLQLVEHTWTVVGTENSTLVP